MGVVSAKRMPRRMHNTELYFIYAQSKFLVDRLACAILPTESNCSRLHKNHRFDSSLIPERIFDNLQSVKRSKVL